MSRGSRIFYVTILLFCPLRNADWKCQTTHVATCRIDYRMGGKLLGRGGGLPIQAHRARTGCAILMQTGSGPSLSITRCHLSYSRDPPLDLSRLEPRASFRVWIASLSRFLHASMSPCFSLLPPLLAIFHLSRLPCARIKSSLATVRTWIQVYARGKNVNKRMHALVRTFFLS